MNRQQDGKHDELWQEDG